MKTLIFYLNGEKLLNYELPQCQPKRHATESADQSVQLIGAENSFLIGSLSLRPTSFTSSTPFLGLKPSANGSAKKMAASSYVHTPLSEQSIRLCQLFPASRGHYPYSESQVFVEGRAGVIQVTSNLHRVLLDLRKECPRKLLWVDQLCIDQADREEKTAFVPKLLSISMKAERTICWAGAPLPSPVPELLRRAQQLQQPSTGGASLITDPDPYHSNFKVTAAALERYHAMPFFKNESDLKDLNDYLNLPYFRRVWIMQDWISGKNVIFQYRLEKISWDDFCTALEGLFLFSTQQCPSSQGLRNILTANYLRRRIRLQPDIKLSRREVLLAILNCGVDSTNPRDQVYAFAWLLKDAEERLTIFDHRSDWDEVFRKIALPLGLLNLSYIESILPSALHLPSWVPVWNHPRGTFLLNHPSSSFEVSAAPNAFHSVHKSFIFKGTTVDSVKATSEYLPIRRHCDHYNVEGFNAIIFSEWFQFAKHTKRRSRPAEDNETKLLHQFADTVQARGCNSIWEASPPREPKEIAEKTRHFLAFLQTEDMSMTPDIQLFYAACFPSHGRRFAVTTRGHFCLVPGLTKPGDVVCVPHGGRVPVVLRKWNPQGQYVNVGECYIQSLMQGAESGLDNCKEELFEVC
ncbi:Nn.00g022750.m01.CDS01 [Neocucurbitaria sp. VM-36]